MKGYNKILYITNARIPTEKAHGYQICKMCEEFSKAGTGVKLLVPTRDNPIKENAFSYYNLKRNFQIKYIKSFDFIKYKTSIGRVCFYLQSLLFLIKLIFKKPDKQVVIYTRTPEIAWLFGLKGYKTIYEAHKWPESKGRLYKSLLKKADKIICNSKGTQERFRNNGFSNTIVAPNGVDLDKHRLPRIDSTDYHRPRKKLGLPINKKIVMYVGHLYEWKGSDVMIGAAEILSDKKDISFILIGGTDKDIEKYKKIIKSKKLINITLLGHQKKEKMPELLKCSDILLLPNAPVTQESIEYSSPIKMFEYMASKKPIIASNLPSIREVLNKNNAVLIKPGDPKALAESISFTLKNPDFSDRIARQAYKDVQNYTWEKRAGKILKFINKYD